MVRLVNGEHLVDLGEQYYKQQERNCFFVEIVTVFFVKNQRYLKKTLEKKN